MFAVRPLEAGQAKYSNANGVASPSPGLAEERGLPWGHKSHANRAVVGGPLRHLRMNPPLSVYSSPRRNPDLDCFLTPASLKTQRHQDSHQMESDLRSLPPLLLCVFASLREPIRSRGSLRDSHLAADQPRIPPTRQNPPTAPLRVFEPPRETDWPQSEEERTAARIARRRKRTHPFAVPSPHCASASLRETSPFPPESRHVVLAQRRWGAVGAKRITAAFFEALRLRGFAYPFRPQKGLAL